jgi:hypothetical protein
MSWAPAQRLCSRSKGKLLAHLAHGGASQRELAFVRQRLRPLEGLVEDGVDISLGLHSGGLRLVNLDGVAHGLFHAVEVEVAVIRAKILLASPLEIGISRLDSSFDTHPSISAIFGCIY